MAVNVAHISLGVAALSLATAAFQGYLGSRNLQIVQRDIARREQLRTCRDVIEAYFEAKLRIARLHVEDARSAEARTQARAAVSRFGALGTYLANFQDEAARAAYTGLTRELERLAASGAAPAGDDLFTAADGAFAAMNAACIRSTRGGDV